MKKKYLLIAVALAGIIAGAGGTVAYFSANDSASNVFTVGNVKAEIEEPSWKPDENHVIIAAEGADTNVSYAKDPQVKNTGANDAYVRIHVSIPKDQADALGAAMATPDSDIQELGGIFKEFGSKWVASENNPATVGDNVVFTYTYTPVLPVGETTEPLFKSVEFPRHLDKTTLNTQLAGEFVVSVSADVVQASAFESAEAAFAEIDGQA